MRVYCARCKLGDYRGEQCLVCRLPFRFRCRHCATFLTADGECACVVDCRQCKLRHSRHQACQPPRAFGELLSSSSTRAQWQGPATIGLGHHQSVLEVSPLEIPPLKLADEPAAIATCSFNFRYHANYGMGALKYDPVGCSAVLDERACGRLRELRGWREVSLQYCLLSAPECMDFSHKILAVPSVGCPKALALPSLLNRLLWVKGAKKRPTVLVVHESEMTVYERSLGKQLAACGVGLVAWSCQQPVVGFGVSRLAAQETVCLFPEARGNVVLCDVNVIDNPRVASGYETDEEGGEPFKKVNRSTSLYASAGMGTGIATKKWDAKKSVFEGTGASSGGRGRPIEQVVIVGDEMLYDPCFITSSEDADLTASIVFEENAVRARPRLSSTTLKARAPIEKVDFNEFGYECNAYMELRAHYLRKLNHEDGVVIAYNKDHATTTLTVGALAEFIAASIAAESVKKGKKEVKLDPVVLRSLIIEKILLQYKTQFLYKL